MQAEQFKIAAMAARSAEIIAAEIERGADLITRNQLLAQRIEELEERVRELESRDDDSADEPVTLAREDFD